MGRRAVLYVEDDDASFLLVQLTIQDAGLPIELYRASDGEKALAFLQKTEPHYQQAPRPDLILLDLNTPKKNGFEVLREIKASMSLRSIPVIVFSSSTLAADKKTSLALGADDFLTKPSSLDLFIEAIKSTLQRK
jgi:chemotaxis family two-component system response regulator Rcp1